MNITGTDRRFSGICCKFTEVKNYAVYAKPFILLVPWVCWGLLVYSIFSAAWMTKLVTNFTIKKVWPHVHVFFHESTLHFHMCSMWCLSAMLMYLTTTSFKFWPLATFHYILITLRHYSSASSHLFADMASISAYRKCTMGFLHNITPMMHIWVCPNKCVCCYVLVLYILNFIHWLATVCTYVHMYICTATYYCRLP